MSYQEAALRHWTDAVHLEERKRYQNADQLIALAAECALKAALCHLPGYSTGSQLAEPYLCHINILWNCISPNNIQRQFPGVAALVSTPNPFADWHIEQRYWADKSPDPVVYRHHRLATIRLLVAVGLLGQRRSV